MTPPATRDRLGLLADCAALFEPWTGPFDREALFDWLAAEFGHGDALERPVPHGPLLSQARPAPDILHVVSENTPHAAFQSLLRGLVVGSRNTMKLPSAGLPEFSDAVRRLPPELAELVVLASELPPDWQERFGVVVVFGSDATLAWFAARTPPTIRLLSHGPKLSIALISDDFEAAARLAARDISLFDQRGCLSIHDVYLDAGAPQPPHDFAALLAEEMNRFESENPRAALPPEQAAAISTLREDVRFRAATNPEQCALWESTHSTAWTVIYEASSRLQLGPLNRVVYVKPWPEGDPAPALGENRRYLSTFALHPFESATAADLISLGAHRICPLGQTQNPSLFWHHDGLPPLASLTTWLDLG